MSQRIELSSKANHRSMLMMIHLINISKVWSCISTTIRANDTCPEDVSVGTVVAIVLSCFTIKIVEPDYIKATLMFSGYWSVYIASMWFYYSTYSPKQLLMFLSLFWLVYELYRQNYEFSDSVIDMFYDFQGDPIIICDNTHKVKVNKMFRKVFSNVGNYRLTQHYTRILSEIKDLSRIEMMEFESSSSELVNMQQILEDNLKYQGASFTIPTESELRVLSFSTISLENIYNK